MLLFTVVFVILFSSCTQKKNDYVKIMHNPFLYNDVVHKLNYVIIYDIFSPPVAARVFAYSNLAAYEVLANNKDHLSSLEGKVKGLNNVPRPAANAKIDYPFASIVALIKVGNALTFSSDTMKLLADSVKSLAKDAGMPDDLFDGSVQFGNQVADSILSWSKKDNYAQTRGSRFTISNLEGHWTPTPPGYFSAVEPKWPTLRCMVMDSANMFPPPPPVPFSKDSASEFYKMAKEVMVTGNTLDSTKKWIANFWDCNSFKLHVEGHAMFATKAMTPGGHWMEVVGTICRNNNADFYKTAAAYTGASIGIYDAFICCWFTKYKFDVLRPETYINKYINQDWMPYLQTPPFPEYNSAHSTISAAAATVLGSMFKNTAFRDSSEREWGWPDRSFKTSDEAAVEVSYSRFYGGIHYKPSVLTAYVQGKQIGNLVMSKLNAKEAKSLK
ncbi:vanadium-dependent haloperoxidase [Ginsengibacter hankyongi]|uniref:Vanadium-dependent haloperoxidase n=2 Tax=Ginsengibacter hankyongi TaxID=2607284 RepID=A0A5J5IGN1_9BACT|nr:vanadium-dependent haloperoxidase [Ginsengibacter hankyongi]